MEREGKNWRGEEVKREEGEGGGKKRKRRGWEYDGGERRKHAVLSVLGSEGEA